jgi:hypothetical protein
VVNLHFGANVIGAGDMNDDALSDVAVGARGDGVTVVTGQNHVFVYRGSAVGMVPFGALFDRPVLALTSAGDINGDGFGDIMAGFGPAASPVYGGASGVDPRYESFLQLCDLGITCVPGYALGGHGDANGDGFGDMTFGDPALGSGETGHTETHYGNQPRGLGMGPHQLQATGEPVAHTGRSNSSQFRLAALGRSPTGRARAGLEWEVKPLGTPFDGLGLARTASFTDTGAIAAPFGSTVSLSALAAFPVGATEIHWRLRVIRNNPLFPHSAWMSGNDIAPGERHLRLGSAMDSDGDGILDEADNCPAMSNASQANADGDSLGDACDACPNDAQNDGDGDGACGNVDNCPLLANPNQANADGDLLGDACDACPNDAGNDVDGDGLCANFDNCPTIANPGQADADDDGRGDVCDSCPLDNGNDLDGDGVCGNVDNCLLIANPYQADTDGDHIGNACDLCPLDSLNDVDGDGQCANTDNCPFAANANQADADGNQIGDVCECGDIDTDNTVTVADVTLLRHFIASQPPAPTAAGLAKCSVIGNATDCNLRDAVVLRRHLAASPLGPGISSVCQAAHTSP